MNPLSGITAEDLPAIYRESYLQAIEAARTEHDPSTDFEAFREYLWVALVSAFGLEVGRL